eukprot:scaffold6820_cov109-Isochrysis_galbana.AAC.2
MADGQTWEQCCKDVLLIFLSRSLDHDVMLHVTPSLQTMTKHAPNPTDSSTRSDACASNAGSAAAARCLPAAPPRQVVTPARQNAVPMPARLTQHEHHSSAPVPARHALSRQPTARAARRVWANCSSG